MIDYETDFWRESESSCETDCWMLISKEIYDDEVGHHDSSEAEEGLGLVVVVLYSDL